MNPTPQITPAESARLAELEADIEVVDSLEVASAKTAFSILSKRDRVQFYVWAKRQIYGVPCRKAFIPMALRWSVFKRDSLACKYCGATENLTLDHMVPESKGGLTSHENLLTACHSCNCEKGTQDYFLFRIQKLAELCIKYADDEQLDASILQWEVELRKLRTTKNNRRLKSA